MSTNDLTDAIYRRARRDAQTKDIQRACGWHPSFVLQRRLRTLENEIEKAEEQLDYLRLKKSVLKEILKSRE